MSKFQLISLKSANLSETDKANIRLSVKTIRENGEDCLNFTWKTEEQVRADEKFDEDKAIKAVTAMLQKFAKFANKLDFTKGDLQEIGRIAGLEADTLTAIGETYDKAKMGTLKSSDEYEFLPDPDSVKGNEEEEIEGEFIPNIPLISGPSESANA